MKITEFYQEFYRRLEKACSSIGCSTKPLNPDSRCIQTLNHKGICVAIIWAHPTLGKVGTSFPREMRLQLHRYSQEITDQKLRAYTDLYQPLPKNADVTWSMHIKNVNFPMYYARFPQPEPLITDGESAIHYLDHLNQSKLQALATIMSHHDTLMSSALNP